MSDEYHLERFVAAQDERRTYERVVAELSAGRKVSHWMWFIFPQVGGLGSSQMSRRFAISTLGEARAYVEHPVLGARLRECTGLVAASDARDAEEIFGGIDAQKLRSSMTLFRRAAPDEPIFATVLDRFYGGRLDPATDARL